MVGVAAWTTGTVIAVCVAWLGANVVIRNSGVGSGMPVLNAAVLPSSATSSPSATPPPAVPPSLVPSGAVSSGAVSSGTVPSRTGPPAGNAGETPTGHAAASGPAAAAGGAGPSPSASASASASAGDIRAYALTGGNVTLEVTDAVQLVTAVPVAGYSVQTWSGTGWLRVDFSSGPQVSSLIASWYEHAPTITVTN
jgi:hypothetical protein